MNRLRAYWGVILCAALLAACEGPRGPGATSPGYITLALSSGSLSLLPGQSATITVKAQATRALGGPVTLSLREADTDLDTTQAFAGLSYAFEPETLQIESGKSASTQLRVAALPTADVRSYHLVVVGKVDGTEESAPLTVTTSGTALGWSRQVGTSGFEVLSGMAAASDGGLYVVGYTTGGFNGEPMTGDLGTYDAFVLKYRRSGAMEWLRQIGTPKSDVLTAVAIDDNDNLYVAGYTYGAFPGFTNAGKADAFVAKLGASGTTMWFKQFGTPEIDQLTAIGVDKQGQTVAAGVTEGGFLGATNKGKTDLFVMRFQADGQQIWSQQLGSPETETASGVAVDSQGAAYVVGGTEGSLPDAMTNGLQDGFILKLNTDGKIAWTRHVGSSAIDTLTAVVIDEPPPNSLVQPGIWAGGYTRGMFSGQLQLGGQDALLVRYNSDGTRTLARQFGTSFTDGIGGLVFAGTKLYSAGSTRGAFSGQDPIGAQDAFIARHNTDGSVDWLHQFGTDQNDIGAAVAGRADTVYVGGTTYGALDGFVLQGDSDGYVVQILPRPSP